MEQYWQILFQPMAIVEGEKKTYIAETILDKFDCFLIAEVLP